MKLSAADRRKLPDSAFALPGRRFPIHDLRHARAALMMKGHATRAEQAEVERKVYARYPELRPEQEKAAEDSTFRDAVKLAPFAGAVGGMLLRRGKGASLLEGAAEGAGFGYLPSAAMDAHDILLRRRAAKAAKQPKLVKTAGCGYRLRKKKGSQ